MAVEPTGKYVNKEYSHVKIETNKVKASKDVHLYKFFIEQKLILFNERLD